MPMIFISYSRKDEDVVEVLAQGLVDARLVVWFDQDLGGGDAWWEKILEHIRSASVLVFALSDDSLRSKPCRAELDYGRKLGLPVLPVQVGPVANLRSGPVADLQTIAFRLDDARSGHKADPARCRGGHQHHHRDTGWTARQQRAAAGPVCRGFSGWADPTSRWSRFG